LRERAEAKVCGRVAVSWEVGRVVFAGGGVEVALCWAKAYLVKK
jgi:hypothetical protein